MLKCYDVFGLLHYDHYWSLISPKFQKFDLNTLQSRNVGVKSVSAELDVWEKYTLSLLHEGLSI